MAKNHGSTIETSRRRTRSGCITCRKRRVKCDEAKPECKRCLSTGRSCEGYGIWGGGQTNAVSGYQPSLFPAMSSQQQNEALGHFQQYLTSKIPGVFESGFWKKLVLQAGAQEPAVLHSVIALAACQMGNNRLTLKAYNQAICELNQHTKCGMKYALRVTLITCMIFVCLELLRGSRNTSFLHLQNGLRLLRDLQTRTGDLPVASNKRKNIITLPQRAETSDDCIIEAFTRLNVQSALFGQGSNYLYELGGDARKEGLRYSSGSSFSSVHESRQHLDLLINRVLRLSSQADSLTMEGKKITDSLRRKRKSLELALHEWMDAFQTSNFMKSSTPSENIQVRLGKAVLQIYHTMIKIMAATCLRGKDEMVYERYNFDFAALLQQVWKLWTMATTEFGQIHHKFSFTADMGYIPPLYYTALRCRDPNLRRIAIDLLAKAPHVEGAWDGRLASHIGKRVMDLEERDVYEGCELVAGVINPLEVSGSSLPTIPAVARVNKVTVIPDPRVCYKTRVEVTKYLPSGPVESLKCDVASYDIEVILSC